MRPVCGAWPTGVLALASSCGAQVNGLYFEFPGGNVFDGTNPVLIEGWVSFEPQYYAFAGYSGSILGSDPSGDWTNYNAFCLDCMGTPGGGNLMGMIFGQLQFPPIFQATTSNPMVVFSVEWTTSDTSKHVVDLTTLTKKFEVFLDESGLSANVAPTEHSAQIFVVPAGGSGAVCLLGVSMLAMRVR